MSQGSETHFFQSVMTTSPFAVATLFFLVCASLRAQTPAPAAAEIPAATAPSATQEQEKAAQVSAETWMSLLDDDKYAESWQTAASSFQGAIKQDQWVSQIGMVRGAFGKASERKLKVIKYMTSVPGAPDGQYVVLQYESTFENKRNAVETITPSLDKDGTWKVSGYYIK